MSEFSLCDVLYLPKEKRHWLCVESSLFHYQVGVRALHQNETHDRKFFHQGHQKNSHQFLGENKREKKSHFCICE